MSSLDSMADLVIKGASKKTCDQKSGRERKSNGGGIQMTPNSRMRNTSYTGSAPVSNNYDGSPNPVRRKGGGKTLMRILRGSRKPVLKIADAAVKNATRHVQKQSDGGVSVARTKSFICGRPKFKGANAENVEAIKKRSAEKVTGRSNHSAGNSVKVRACKLPADPLREKRKRDNEAILEKARMTRASKSIDRTEHSIGDSVKTRLSREVEPYVARAQSDARKYANQANDVVDAGRDIYETIRSRAKKDPLLRKDGGESRKGHKIVGLTYEDAAQKRGRASVDRTEKSFGGFVRDTGESLGRIGKGAGDGLWEALPTGNPAYIVGNTAKGYLNAVGDELKRGFGYKDGESVRSKKAIGGEGKKRLGQYK